MRIPLVLVGCLLVLCGFLVIAAEEGVDNQEEEEEYEDIAVAESQDIARAHIHQNKGSDETSERHRTRPRGRKRRRRLRKRPRSTTPSFIQEYDPERTEREEVPVPPEAVEDEVTYPRRRPMKRRRRPGRRKPDYDKEHEQGPDSELLIEKPQEYERPRNTPRRRRKNGRKRIRLTTESLPESNNNDETESRSHNHEESRNYNKDVSFDEMTTQIPEVVVQTNNFSEQEIPIKILPLTHNEETTPSLLLTSSFTPKEITEINHKLELLSEKETIGQDYHVSGLGAFGFFRPTSDDTITQNLDENYIVSSPVTTKDYAWINRFNPQPTTEVTKPITEEESSIDTTTAKIIVKGEELNTSIQNSTIKNIKNIEQIIENRKNLFSKSKRLPPTSAVIRRRIRIKKLRNSTITKENISDNTIPTINPSYPSTKETCHGVDCALNVTSLLSNHIVPSALLPSGFPTMPEVLSTAELIQKMSLDLNKTEATTKFQSELIDTDYPHDSSRSNLIIITPSTLIRSPDGNENVIFPTSIKDTKRLNTVVPTEIETEIETEKSTPSTTPTKNGDTTVDISTTETTTIVTSPKTDTTTIIYTTISKNPSNTDVTEETKFNAYTTDVTTESEKLKLDGVDVSNVNDQILELIMDEMGKARVKRILELRNMTLSELIAHRERGAGHFSEFTKNITMNDLNTTEGTQTVSTAVTNEEEQTEEMIVEKAKQFLNDFKKTDYTIPTLMETSYPEKDTFGQRIKVEGTVIPVPINEPTHTSIQFPEDGVLGAFPKFMFDIAEKRSEQNSKKLQKRPSLYSDTINKPKDVQLNDKREPRVFESMPKFDSESGNKENLEISPYPDWRITVSKSSTEKSSGFPGISKEIRLVAPTRPEDVDDVILLDEGEEVHHLRNHILGGNINVETGEMTDEDYPVEKKVPAAVKSAIVASGALLGLAIFGFLAVLVSCKIRQRRARLRARRDILCEHLAEDLRSSQRSLTPVLRKTQFNHNIHSNTASNRHYYLWRTLRKTFQYE